MEIQIDIAKKVASVVGTPVIICGNTDYTVRFTFDAEWLGAASKTARFVWIKNGSQHFEDVLFTGSTCKVPLMNDITTVLVGVYSGDLHTTTPARIPCVKSILCGGGTHEEPTPDVYNQLLALLEDSAMQTPVTLAVEERNNGQPFTFWLGTTAEYEALAEYVENCFYILTDEKMPDDVRKSLEILSSAVEEIGGQASRNASAIESIIAGDKPVARATNASHATNATAATVAQRASKIYAENTASGENNFFSIRQQGTYLVGVSYGGGTKYITAIIRIPSVLRGAFSPLMYLPSGIANGEYIYLNYTPQGQDEDGSYWGVCELVINSKAYSNDDFKIDHAVLIAN